MVTINSIDSNIPIELSKGGTNATTMATNTGILKYDGTRLVTSSTALIDASNRYTNTSQPAFLAYVNTTITNVTGDGTIYTVIFDTEVFDQGGDFNLGTSTFTAPITGRYALSFYATLIGGTSITASNIQIVSSNRTYNSNCTAIAPPNAGVCNGTVNLLIDMDSGDTATFSVFANDSGGKVDDVQGAAGNVKTAVSGHLVC